ncbi:MAG: PAS domain S-box protein [Candidatus Heimdallarchaeaceae archaeon]
MLDIKPTEKKDTITILHVDDEEAFLEISRIYLEKISRNELLITSISSPLKALELIRESSFDCIIADYQMSSMNGLQLLEIIKKEQINILFILFTGKGREEVAIQALNLGADFYIKKGLDIKSQFAELYHLIKVAVNNRRTHRKLVYSEKKYSSLFEKMPAGYAYYKIIYNEEGVPVDYEFVEVNSKYEEITGLKREDIIGKGVLELYAEEEAILSEWLQIAAEVVKSDRIYNLEHYFKTLDKWFSIIAYSIEEDYFAVIISDITEDKIKEREIKQSEVFYKAIFNHTGTATCMVEQDTTITLVNSHFEVLSGYSKEEIEGKKSWTEFVVPEDLERMKRYYYKRREDPNSAPTSYEFQFIDRYGKVKDILLTIDIIPGTTKSISSLLDITVRKELEAERKARTEELQLFLDIITHDIRNYQTSCRGYLDLVFEAKDEDSVKKYITKAQTSAALAENVLQNAMALLILKEKPLEEEKRLQTIKLKDILINAEESAKLQYPEKDITIDITDINPDSTIVADYLCQQLFVNIFTNSIKYDPHEKVIVKVKERKEKNKLIVSIIDYAKGIPPEKREQIFERFSEFRKEGKGSGLGLFIVKSLVERYGGRIWIESRDPEDYTKGTITNVEFRTQ